MQAQCMDAVLKEIQAQIDLLVVDHDAQLVTVLATFIGGKQVELNAAKKQPRILRGADE